MLPPPTTMRPCTPRETTSGTWLAIRAQKAGSTPYERSPRSASPDSLSRMRRYFGRTSLTSSAVLAEGVAGEAPDLDVLAHRGDRVGDQLADRLLGVAERLLEEHRARLGIPLV